MKYLCLLSGILLLSACTTPQATSIHASGFLYDPKAPPILMENYIYDDQAPPLRASEFLYP